MGYNSTGRKCVNCCLRRILFNRTERLGTQYIMWLAYDMELLTFIQNAQCEREHMVPQYRYVYYCLTFLKFKKVIQ